MKVNIEIDCTPDEARTFLGLPYVKPLQEAVMASIERHMLDAAAAMSPDVVLKTWFSSITQNPDQFLNTFSRFFAQPFGPPPIGRS